MKIDILNSYNFVDYMKRYPCSEKFSIEGLHALYDWFEDIYSNDENDYTINANELCIFFDEYKTIHEMLEDFMTDDEIKAYTLTNDNAEAVHQVALRFMTEDELIEKLSEEYNIIPFKKYGNEYYSLLLNQ